MESIDVHFIGIGANKSQQTLAHGDGTGVSKSETENIPGIGIRLQKNLTNTGSQDLGFSRSGTSNNQYRPVNSVHGQFLFRVQMLIKCIKDVFLVHFQT